MLRIYIAALFLLAALTTPVFAQSLANLYLSRSYWETFDWEKAGSSTVWLDAGFRPYSQAVDDGTRFHHNQKITIDGMVFVASLAEYTKKLLNPHFTTLAPLADELAGCERLSARWASAFGSTPQPISNKYYFMTTSFPMDEVVRQWQIGNTRISLVCGAIGPNKSGFDMISVNYEAATDENKVEPPIHLTCSQTYVLSGDQQKQQSTQPLALSFIPAKKVVTNADLVRIGDLVHISSSVISFRIRTKEIESKYQISRIDGTLTGTALANVGGRTLATYAGSCEVRKPDARKF